MPKSIYVQFLSEQPNANIHYLNRLVKILNHFISIEPENKPKGFECHHIVPKSWKPEWIKEPNNLIKVLAKSHYVIHHLMYKAFPANHSMNVAFHRVIHGKHEQKITAKVYEVLRFEFSKLHSKWNLEHLANGTHNFLDSEFQRQNSLRQISNGTHPLLGGEVQKKNNAERLANGTHHLLDKEKARQRALKRVADGTHHFCGEDNVKKQIANGNHSSQIKKTCPHCGKTCSSNTYSQWHGDHCRKFFGIDSERNNPLP